MIRESGDGRTGSDLSLTRPDPGTAATVDIRRLEREQPQRRHEKGKF